MLLAPKRRARTAAALCFVLSLVVYLWTSPAWAPFLLCQTSPSPLPHFDSNSSNETLGFGIIYVVTENSATWRVKGLVKAANLTGLQIQVPFHDCLKSDVQLGVDQEPISGYTGSRAFLKHLAILKLFAQSQLETALILEDDVDFSIGIRAQMDSFSRAIWDHSNQSWTQEEAVADPYRQTEWDLLWPGHYGISFVQGSEVFEYNDSYALPWSRLTTSFNGYYEQMASHTDGNPPRPQQVIFNAAPLCTFAYAVTRAHAARLVQRILVDGAYSKEHTPFDTALHVDCVGLEHRCVAPVPQLFHHHQVVGERSIDAHGDGELQDTEWYRRKHKYTYNVEWSARCNAEQAGEQIDDKWQCLPNRDDPPP